jgi:uncharacterized damage-inducible protein DinB
MLREMAVGLALTAVATPLVAEDPSAFKQEYLWELGYATHNLTALAEAIPAERFSWKPGEGVRSVSEVYVHVALGNFLLLDIVGHAAPEDLYGKVAATGRERSVALGKRNAELEKSVTQKARVVELLKRSLEAVRVAMDGATTADLDKRVDFFGTEKTARAVYLRMLAHAHEHMGQSIAYARVIGIVPPWSQPASKE